MPKTSDATGPTGSLEESVAKWLNLVMFSLIGVALLAFAAWDTVQQTILLIEAAPAQRWQHVEKLFTAAMLLLLLLVTALAWRRRSRV